METISKSALKPKLLKYLRKVQKKREKIVVTDYGKPVATILPYNSQKDSLDLRQELAGSVLNFESPLEPVGLEDWELK